MKRIYFTLIMLLSASAFFAQSLFYTGNNCGLSLDQHGYAYKNGKHYLVWSNGSFTSNSLYSNYDNYVKLSTSNDGINWITNNIISTTYGSYNLKIAIDDNNFIHIVYTQPTAVITPDYGPSAADIVYATNKTGSWVKETVIGTYGTYKFYSPDLIIVKSNQISVFFHSDCWWGYGSPLLVKKFDGLNWGNTFTVSNNGILNNCDDRSNIFKGYNIENNHLVLYISNGTYYDKCWGTKFFSNKIFKIIETGDNYVLDKTYNDAHDVNINNSNVLIVSGDQKSIYLNDVLIYSNNDFKIENPSINTDGSIICFSDSINSYIIKKSGSNFQVTETLNDQNCMLINNLKIIKSNWSENPKFIWIGTLKSEISTSVFPQLMLSAATVIYGNNLTITGKSFTPNSTAQLNFFSGSSITVNTDIYGQFKYNYTIPASISGVQSVSATDVKSGLSTNTKQFIINQTTLQSFNLSITSPLQSIIVDLNEKFQIEWKDKMVLGNSYTISSSKRNYKYIIEFSDNNGSSWKTINSLEGLAYIDSWVTLNYSTFISASGNGYLIRIRDFYNSSNSQITPIINVRQATLTGNLKTELNWDYSYPLIDRDVIGVAADGTSRIFLNLSKINNSLGSQISSVKVSLSDDSNGIDPTKLGKVMVATQTTVYGSEANGITTITTTDNTANKTNYTFWYVAPDDFTGANSDDTKNASRRVIATFTVIYSNATSETKQQQITIVRPPLMLVHGLASDGSTWDNFCHNEMGYEIPFIKDSRFKTCKAVNISPDASFKVNASQLVNGTNNPNSFSFQGVISDLRSQGYAANRVDYVCHSMGGSVLRSIFDNYYPQFTRTENVANGRYKNYERGYINKVIMIGTPNNGSPLADIINRYAGDLSCELRTSIQGVFGNFKNKSLLLMLLQPIDLEGTRCLSYIPPFYYKTWEYEPSDAVKDLLIDKTKGGVSFRATNTRAHLIAGDFMPGAQYNTNGIIPQEIVNIVKNSGDEMLQDILNHFLKIAISKESNSELKNFLTQILKSDITPTGKALAFFDKMAMEMDAFNTGTFIPESDLVVSVNSQLAGKSRPISNSTSNVSVIDNFVSHAIFPGSETKNSAIGNQVNDLLNKSINSTSFDVIPATDDRNNIVKKSKDNIFNTNNLNDNPIISKTDTTKIQIISPKSNTNIYVDSILNVQLRIKDTTNLKSVELKFQNKTYYIDSLFIGTIDFGIQINSNLLDNQIIQMEGFYCYPDSGVFVYDMINVNIITKDTLIDFGVNPKILYLFNGQIKSTDYYSIYRHSIATGSLSSEISAIVNNTSIVEFDNSSNTFKGITSGETFAIVSYKEFSDTLYLVVHPTIIDSTLNQTDIPEISIKTDENRSIFIYPNPTNGHFSLEFENLSQKDGQVIICNILGQEISILNIVDNLTTFDISKQPKGIYFVRYRDKNRNEISKKLLKM